MERIGHWLAGSPRWEPPSTPELEARVEQVVERVNGLEERVHQLEHKPDQRDGGDERRSDEQR